MPIRRNNKIQRLRRNKPKPKSKLRKRATRRPIKRRSKPRARVKYAKRTVKPSRALMKEFFLADQMRAYLRLANKIKQRNLLKKYEKYPKSAPRVVPIPISYRQPLEPYKPIQPVSGYDPKVWNPSFEQVSQPIIDYEPQARRPIPSHQPAPFVPEFKFQEPEEEKKEPVIEPVRSRSDILGERARENIFKPKHTAMFTKPENLREGEVIVSAGEWEMKDPKKKATKFVRKRLVQFRDGKMAWEYQYKGGRTRLRRIVRS